MHQNLLHLFVAANPMMHPVGNVLARNAQSRAILHQGDVVVIRYLGTGDLGDLADRTRRNLRSMQRRSTLMCAIWRQAELL